MIEQVILEELLLDDSSDLFVTEIEQIPIPKLPSPIPQLESEEIKSAFPYFLVWRRPLEVSDQVFSILIIPQVTGNFVARTSTSTFNAIGQGRTEEEALQDIKSAIEALMEEDANPSGDVEWPENCQ